MNDLGNLLQAIQRAVLSTPTMLYYEDPGFQWPSNVAADGRGTEFRVCFALPRMLLSVFGHRGKRNVTWNRSN